MVLTKTFVPYEQFHLDIILKVTAAICNLTLADLKCGTNLLQVINQGVSDVVLFVSVESTNMG